MIECAAELYEYLGDYGFELIAGVVERRSGARAPSKTGRSYFEMR